MSAVVLMALGAAEVLAPKQALAATIAVNTIADELNGDGDCSLREAIEAANTDTAVDACPAGSGADSVSLPLGTYALGIAGAKEDSNATGDLDITGDLIISGAAAATTIIDGSDLDRVVHVLAPATVQISDVTITNGQLGSPAPAGAGILSSGTLTLQRATVSGNFGDTGGGGIENSGALTIVDSTVSGNAVLFGGGGIYNYGPGATAAISNSTVSGNSAKGGGSGISNWAPMTLRNSTVSSNVGFAASGIQGGATIKNTIVANNSLVGGGALDCDGALASEGYNLIEDTSEGAAMCLIVGDTTGNIIGVDPTLGPLADNGGQTQTRALLPGSPAIDAGSPACPPPAADQRGVARPQGAGCDIGSFELEPPMPTPTVTPPPTLTPTQPAPPPVGGTSRDLKASASPLGANKSIRPNSGLIGAALTGSAAVMLFSGVSLYLWRRTPPSR